MLIYKSSLLRRAFVIAGISAFAATGPSPCRALLANAQQGVSPPSALVSSYQSHLSEEDHAHSEATHRYSSTADRAKDALLITEVKSALADDGVAEDSPIVVDCDHGKILLSGVMKSAEDAKRAGNIAASAAGVMAVKNQLTWH